MPALSVVASPLGPLADLGVTRILLLRHAETAAPALFHGAESDVELGDAGRDQAKAAARLIARARPSAVYASAMRRAQETATPIAQACEVEVIAVPALHERRMGTLSGRPMTEGWDAYIAAMRAWQAGDLDASHAGGESFRAICDRVVPTLTEIAGRHRGETVVVVAHGVVIRVLLASLLDGGPGRFEQFGIGFVVVNDLRTDGSSWALVGVHDPLLGPPGNDEGPTAPGGGVGPEGPESADSSVRPPGP